MKTVRIAAAVLVVSALGGAVPALTLEEPGMPDLAGAWTGKGQVQKNDTSNPMNVTCTIEGNKPADNKVGFDGECRAMLIMKRAIGATLTREGDQFTGVYTGSNAGPAELSGTMNGGEELVLSMTFERPVNGDDQAVMTIRRSHEDAFTITTKDRMELGVEVTTSDITFERNK